MVLKLKLDTSNFDKVFPAFLERFPRLIALNLSFALRKILIPAMREQLKANDSVWRGNLSKGLGISVRRRGNEIVTVVKSQAPYAEEIEFGGQPREEPHERIKQWLIEKNKIKPKSAQAKANAIVKLIKEKGTMAHPFIEPSWEANKDEVFREFLARTKRKLTSSSTGRLQRGTGSSLRSIFREALQAGQQVKEDTSFDPGAG